MMKKILMMMATMAMTVTLASCGDDDPIKTETISYGVQNLITKTVTGQNFYDYAGGYLRFNIDYVAGTVGMEVHDIKFSAAQPVTASFNLDNLKATFASKDRFVVTGTNYSVMDGYTVNDVRCNANRTLPMYYMTYSVVSPRTTSRVYVFPTTLYSQLSDEDDLDYANATETYAKFDVTMNAEGGYQGDVYLIKNVKFAQGMPITLDQVRIPCSDDKATITGTATGYTIEGSGITGLYLQGSTEIPFEASTIDNLKVVVDVVNKAYSISFNCMGGEFVKDGKLYL